MIGGDPVASTGKAQRPHESEDKAGLTNEVILSIHPPTLPSLLPLQHKSRENFFKYGVPLYQAALEGDWETAEGIFNEDPYWITAPITKRNDTALHIAAAAKHYIFVKKLVDLMINADDRLESRNTLYNTAFCFAASSGIIETAKVMVEKNRGLPNLKGSKGLTPLHMAILVGHRAMVDYLLKVTDDRADWMMAIALNCSPVRLRQIYVALHFLDKHPHLALERNGNNETVLHTLAQKHLETDRRKQSTWKSFVRRCQNMDQDEGEHQLELALQVAQKAWDEFIKQDEDIVSDLIGNPWRVLFVAAEMGNVEFLITLILSYPDVIWKVDEQNRSIFHVAVANWHEDISKLIHEIGAVKDLIASYTDKENNNMLHLAARIAPSDRLNCISGAALQMQRELLWFEAVKDVVQPQYAVAENAFGETPRALFTKTHKTLRGEGEEWMKKTDESCTLVATLITTVVFTAAFTLPGGNDQNNGSPVLLKQASFTVFAISNAVSLFASSTSILMFLSILASRYAEYDFLKSLPFKLVVGLTSLFVSIATMMMAFTTTFFITYQRGVKWIPIPIALLAAIPVVLFVFQHRSRTLFQSRKLSWKNRKHKRQ